MVADADTPFLDKSDPSSWKALNGLSLAVGRAAESAGIERETLELMYVLISQLNRCAYCLDMHTRRALESGADPLKLAQLPAWHESAVFTEVECAALAIGEVTTTLPAVEDRQAALAIARATLGDQAFTALEWAALTMNAYNRVSILSEHPVRLRKQP
ncbi:carboxymuconolactone decarboxylase family protein [Brevibacterium daeguense]|uniref:Carboxymuconolactone decarboxylase family protein n=1 Tax=Brevibacterium daeguense TaxID=909936 RepID=A0ABP8EJ88_9MICO|nr:carboxymuconolactone decarboxylase family protein [Brevibacterium daeguense]